MVRDASLFFLNRVFQMSVDKANLIFGLARLDIDASTGLAGPNKSQVHF